MAESKSTKVKVSPGIFQRPGGGFHVYVRSLGQRVDKHFPKGTPLDVIHAWRSATHASIANGVTQEALRLRWESLPAIEPPLASALCWVYFIQCERFIKIGHASNLPRRLEELQTAVPFELRLVGAFPSGDPTQSERALHRRFASIRVRGEWFQLTRELREVIRDSSALRALPCHPRLAIDCTTAPQVAQNTGSADGAAKGENPAMIH